MKNIIRFALVILALGMLAACGSSSSNPVAVKQLTLYGTTVGTAALGPSNLVLLNPTTGAYIRTIGSVGYYVNGLTYDSTSGKLYGTTSKNDPNFASGLIEINKSTGVGTPIGTGAGQPVLTPTVNSLGAMFAWADDGTDVIDDLVSIDKVTGLASAPIGDAGLSTSENGLAFDNNDVLVLVTPNGSGGTNAYSIDTATGASAYLITFSGLPRAHHGDFDPRTNYYWGIDVTNDSGIPERNLLVLDIATGTLVDTLPTADNLHCVTFGYRLVYY